MSSDPNSSANDTSRRRCAVLTLMWPLDNPVLNRLRRQNIARAHFLVLQFVLLPYRDILAENASDRASQIENPYNDDNFDLEGFEEVQKELECVKKECLKWLEQLVKHFQSFGPGIPVADGLRLFQVLLEETNIAPIPIMGKQHHACTIGGSTDVHFVPHSIFEHFLRDMDFDSDKDPPTVLEVIMKKIRAPLPRLPPVDNIIGLMNGIEKVLVQVDDTQLWYDLHRARINCDVLCENIKIQSSMHIQAHVSCLRAGLEKLASQLPSTINQPPVETSALLYRCIEDCLIRHNEIVNAFTDVSIRGHSAVIESLLNRIGDSSGHQMILRLRDLSTILKPLCEIELPRVLAAHRKEAIDQLPLIATIAAFFSGATATMIQFTYENTATRLSVAVNTLFFSSLLFSVASVMNSLLFMKWYQSNKVPSPEACLPKWLAAVFLDGPNTYVLIAGAQFSVAMTLFAYSSNQSMITHLLITILFACHAIAIFLFFGWFVYMRVNWSALMEHALSPLAFPLINLFCWPLFLPHLLCHPEEALHELLDPETFFIVVITSPIWLPALVVGRVYRVAKRWLGLRRSVVASTSAA